MFFNKEIWISNPRKGEFMILSVVQEVMYSVLSSYHFPIYCIHLGLCDIYFRTKGMSGLNTVVRICGCEWN